MPAYTAPSICGWRPEGIVTVCHRAARGFKSGEAASLPAPSVLPGPTSEIQYVHKALLLSWQRSAQDLPWSVCSLAWDLCPLYPPAVSTDGPE